MDLLDAKLQDAMQARELGGDVEAGVSGAGAEGGRPASIDSSLL
jgi:hypothetical protein